MRFLRQSNGQSLDTSVNSYLDRGGEGEIHKVRSDLVAKLYHDPHIVLAQKLAVMIANPPIDPLRGQGRTSIAWPVDILVTADAARRPAGFLMPYVGGTASLDKVYIPSNRRQYYPLFNYRYLLRTAHNLAAAVSALHAGGYVIGDLNESNVRVANDALITFVDTDSFR